MKKEEKKNSIELAVLATFGVLATSLISMTIHELNVIRQITRDEDDEEPKKKNK